MAAMRCPLVRISQVVKHSNADSLDVINVLGYRCVDRSGKWKEGDFAVYIPIDSLVDSDRQEFQFLKKSDKDKIVRLKTVKLRGEISQGVLLPPVFGRVEGDDCSDFFGVEKYEPVDRNFTGTLAGSPRGNFPSHLPKTDVERWQNYPEIFKAYVDSVFVATEKVEGSSSTCFLKSGEDGQIYFGVCSRNLELKPEDTNSFWKSAVKFEIEKKLRSMAHILGLDMANLDIALQGELTGPGIQGNIYAHKDLEFYAFDVLVNGRYVPSNTFFDLCGRVGLRSVPVVHIGTLIKDEDMVSFATAPSLINKNTLREGLVWKLYNSEEFHPKIGRVQLKVISPEYLLKQKHN